MEKQVLIVGASIAGLTLAYWLNRQGYQVTLVEIANGLRRGGSPIDVRGDALTVAREMGILDQIKAYEFVHTDEIVNANDKPIVQFSINAQAEYTGDIEIHRDDLVNILYQAIPAKAVEFLFKNRIETLIQTDDSVAVRFQTGERREFAFVFGADGTHSTVRKLVFGPEAQFARFFGAYFALAEAPAIKANSLNSATLYQEVGKTAMLYSFKNAVHAGLLFRSSRLDYDYRNRDQHKQILRDHFDNGLWKIPQILAAMLASNELYFDEVVQIQMPTWTKGRVALVGDAAHTTGFPTGMGTSLAMQGAARLAFELDTFKESYPAAFASYYQTFQPFVVSVQARIERGLNWLLPPTEAALEEAIKRFL
ncbi:FAD-dependent monooxygenase [Spirosoma radiotolerans]|uniref:FAD-binding monooxygenase n=1 Tax=Spirosoma radiotolerans TaxID=1379870 RepID=A0A0E3V6C1_9BACT|nr:FAD-dependent monooxygenase [Spirosoma radiotolerans]AKD54902.1 FAD-binding monooxygenase [Spirosoma radiotolerans]